MGRRGVCPSTGMAAYGRAYGSYAVHQRVVCQQHAGHAPSIHIRLAHVQTSPQPRRRGCKSPGIVAHRRSPVIPMSARAIKGLPVAEVCRRVVACTLALRTSAPMTSTPLCSVPCCNGQDA